MGIFEDVKQAVPVPQAGLAYGLEVKRGNMALCPFHPDGNPSMKLYEDHFYCFGCHASGDVVTLTGKLLGLSAFEAARRLKQDFSVTGGAPPRLAPQVCRETQALRLVNQTLRRLCAWREQYRPLPGQEPNEKYVEAVKKLPGLEDMSDLLTYGPKEDRERAARMVLAHPELWKEETI